MGESGTMSEDAKALSTAGDKLFEARQPLLNLWQDIAEHFYPQRADFTVERTIGDDFTTGLTTSYPIMCARELGNTFGSMLRPSSKQWFMTRTSRWDRVDAEGKRWLESATETQRRAMYDPATKLTNALKQGDMDFASFGQCVISVELNSKGDALLYRNWHLRDVVWCESPDGKIDTVHRKWTPSRNTLTRFFGDKVHAKVREGLEKDRYATVQVRHVVVPSDQCEPPKGKKRWREPYVSIFLDTENAHVMERVGSWTPKYVIPRWQTVAGSQYAFSPATITALPDARLIQAMTLSLLEAGEKAANPPMIATQGAIRSDVQLFSGGVTWIDQDYNEKMGEALRPVTQDSRGFPLGVELRQDVKEMLAQAFFLNKIQLPPIGRDMTAFEVGQRVSEYVRQALPLFEPMEMDYNGALCEATFDILMRGGAFGDMTQMPRSLSGQEIRFEFTSPLTASLESQKTTRLMEAKAMLAEAAALDSGALAMLDVRTALRDALEGAGTPSKWIRSEKDMEASAKALAEKQQTQQVLQTMGQGAEVAQKIGDAQQSLQGMAA